MAICEYCQQEMRTSDGCADAPIVIDGTAYPPVRYGRESASRRWKPEGRCGDCAARPGQVHHHGCDVEECPACGGQSISCGCLWAGEEEDEEDSYSYPSDDDYFGIRPTLLTSPSPGA